MKNLEKQEINSLYEKYPELDDPYFFGRTVITIPEDGEDSHRFLIELGSDKYIVHCTTQGAEAWYKVN